MFNYKDIELIKEAFGINDNSLLNSNEIGDEFKELFQEEYKRMEEMNKLEQQIYNTGVIPREYLFLKDSNSKNLFITKRYVVEL